MVRFVFIDFRLNDSGTPATYFGVCSGFSPTLFAILWDLLAAGIECKQLVKTYPGEPPVEAVRGLDLEVQQGECFGLLGPNGAARRAGLRCGIGLVLGRTVGTGRDTVGEFN